MLSSDREASASTLARHTVGEPERRSVERVLRAAASLAVVICLTYIAVNVYAITAAGVGSSGAGDILVTIVADLWPAFVILGGILTLWFFLYGTLAERRNNDVGRTPPD